MKYSYNNKVTDFGCTSGFESTNVFKDIFKSKKILVLGYLVIIAVN